MISVTVPMLDEAAYLQVLPEVLRAALDAIGGVRPIDLMEDFDLVRRIERFAVGPFISTNRP